jgi:diguanylate cyclase (GGDEF)-like protein
MLKFNLGRLWAQFWSLAFEDASTPSAGWLFRAKQHPPRFTTLRVVTIVARVRLFAAVLALVSPLWVLFDFWAFGTEVAENLALVRTLCAVAFSAVVVMAQGSHTLGQAYRALFFLFAVPAAFFLFAYLRLMHVDADGVLDGFSLGFGLLPIVMLAGIALFPLTVAECACLFAFMLAVNLGATVPYHTGSDWVGYLGSFWVLPLVGTIAMCAALLQLGYLIISAREGVRDNLTSAFSRSSGEELLELQFTWSQRANCPLSLALVEIDGFQNLTDKFGYVAADKALVGVTQILYDSLRAGDTLIRWTDKRFLLVLPFATAKQAADTLHRLMRSGLGKRPDGQPLTTSIGIVERIHDAAEDSWQLIDLAEARILDAQLAGGNRAIEPDVLSAAVTVTVDSGVA